MTLPNSWLIHKIQYFEKLPKRDEYGNLQYKEAVEIENVVVQMGNVYKRVGTETQIIANGIIFTNDVDTDYVLESIVIFEGEEFTLEKIQRVDDLETGKVSHYELEVL